MIEKLAQILVLGKCTLPTNDFKPRVADSLQWLKLWGMQAILRKPKLKVREWEKRPMRLRRPRRLRREWQRKESEAP